MDGAAHAKIHVTHYPKPTGKLFWFRDGIPDTPTRDRQKHGSFDTIRKSHWISSPVKQDVRVFCLIGNSQVAYREYTRKNHNTQPQSCLFLGWIRNKRKMGEVVGVDMREAVLFADE